MEYFSLEEFFLFKQNAFKLLKVVIFLKVMKNMHLKKITIYKLYLNVPTE